MIIILYTRLHAHTHAHTHTRIHTHMYTHTHTTDIKPLLTPEVVTDLVLATMSNLPKQQPIIFKNSYTPIAAAASEAQVTHLARLLASQMTSAGIGVGAEAKSIKPTRPVSVLFNPVRPGVFSLTSLTLSDLGCFL